MWDWQGRTVSVGASMTNTNAPPLDNQMLTYKVNELNGQYSRAKTIGIVNSIACLILGIGLFASAVRK